MMPVECSSGYGDVTLTYALTYANLSAAGIESGWTCSVSACFKIRERTLKFVYAPTGNCTLPFGEYKHTCIYLTTCQVQRIFGYPTLIGHS